MLLLHKIRADFADDEVFGRINNRFLPFHNGLRLIVADGIAFFVEFLISSSLVRSRVVRLSVVEAEQMQFHPHAQTCIYVRQPLHLAHSVPLCESLLFRLALDSGITEIAVARHNLLLLADDTSDIVDDFRFRAENDKRCVFHFLAF